MSSSSDWLQRLDQATDYRELQQIFAQLRTAARTAEDPLAMVASIDEAVRRLERERVRDEAELAEFERDYDSFKDQQSGVVGWFKRHLPFTETRRLEVQHRQQLADQKAETLADRVVIARAQVLKQHLLPHEQRVLGRTVDHWQDQLASSRRAQMLTDYGHAVAHLLDELRRSNAFIQEVDECVDAFEQAAFSAAADREQQRADISEARTELAELKRDVQQKQSICDAALQQAGQMVCDQLSQQDPDFDRLRGVLQRLTSADAQLRQNRQVIDEWYQQLEALNDLAVKLEQLPADREKLAAQIEQHRAEHRDATRRRDEAQRLLAEHQQDYELIEREVDRAKAAFESAKRVWDSYQRQQQGKAEIDESMSFEVESPVEVQFREAQESLQAAEHRWHSVREPYHQASRAADQAAQRLDQLQRQLASFEQQDRSLEDAQQRQQRAVGEQFEQVRRTFEMLTKATDEVAEAVQPEGRHAHRAPLDQFPLSELRYAIAAAQRLGVARQQLAALPPITRHALDEAGAYVDQLEQEQKRLQLELRNRQQEWADAFQTQCRRLLGEPVAAAVIDAFQAEMTD